MSENETTSSRDLFQKELEFQTMKHTYCRLGFAIAAMFAIWYAFLFLVSLAVSLISPWDDSWIVFFDRYLLVFNELGLALGMVAAMKILKPLPKREIHGESIGVGRCLKYILIAWSFASFGNMISTSMISLWNLETGYEVENAVDLLVMDSEMLILFLMACLFGPFLEEFFFRKLLIDHTRQYGELPCVLLSGLLFALFHGNFTQFFYAFALGCLYAHIYFRSGSFALTVVLHALFNFLSGVLPVILSGSEFAMRVYTMLSLIFVILGAIFAVAGLRRFHPTKGECSLSSRACLSAIFGNVGMVVSLLYMGLVMIGSLFVI